MHELMFQAGVKGMSERSELIPCIIYRYMYHESTIFWVIKQLYIIILIHDYSILFIQNRNIS